MGFVDVFYAYDFNKPGGNVRQPFLYNHNRHNEINLNLGLIKLSVSDNSYRANLALQTGTYPLDNYAAEPGVLKNVFEANAGISLDKKHRLWLDAGVFASHLGFESAISMDNWTLTRSLSAENSPYYLAGARLSYSPDKRWNFAALFCNGWQRIQRFPGNSLPSFGTQIQYKPADKFSLNWSTFAGTDSPDSNRVMRYFNNFYGKLLITERIGLIAGFDFGLQQTKPGGNNYNFWYCPTLIARYSLGNTWAMALRAEYYQDLTGVIIETNLPYGFSTFGYSLNLDYLPNSRVACRMEGRWLNSPDPLFQKGGTLTQNNLTLVTSIAIKFDSAIRSR